MSASVGCEKLGDQQQQQQVLFDFTAMALQLDFSCKPPAITLGKRASREVLQLVHETVKKPCSTSRLHTLWWFIFR